MQGKKVKRKVLSLTVASSMVLGSFAPSMAKQVSAEEATFQDLIISEYIEGSSSNKALELYNGTSESIDLSDYTLETYYNGKTTSNSLVLSGTIGPGEVYIVSNTAADPVILSLANKQDNGVANFNGNDVIVLKKAETIVDSIGQIGSDVTFAADVTLTRKSGVAAGDTNASDAFDKSIGWDQHLKDTFTNLGSHLSDGQTPEPEPVEQYTILDARSVETGTAVKVKGTVTASFLAGGANNLYVQDETAGVIIRGNGLTAQLGDEISAEGKVNDYYGMAQIEVSSSNVEIITEGKGVPAPQVLNSADLSSENGEQYEGEFVQFENVAIESKNSHDEFTATDGSGRFMIAPEQASVLQVGKTYEVLRGVVDYSFGEYKLIPRSTSDIIETVFSVTANPASGSVVEGTKVSLQTAAAGGTIHYTKDGSIPTADSPAYSSPIELTADTTIKAVVVKDTETSEVATFTYDILKPADNVDIHDIQGKSHTSPYKDVNVSNVDGIVTAKSGTSGFYIQEETPDDNVATSEAIYVYKRDNNVNIGDTVNVSGQVKEWEEDGYDDAKDLLTTQITASAVEVLSSGNELPAAVVIGSDRTPPTEVIEDDDMKSFEPKQDGLDFYESLEGMLIEIPDATITGPIKYDEMPVVTVTSDNQLRTDAGGILISPEDYNPERMLIDVDGIDINVKTGDMLDGSITGVVSYDYSNFKIRPTSDIPAVIDGGIKQEVTTINPEVEDLTIATYNIENFHAGTDASKVEKIAKSILNNLKTPDIVGLVEVQDNNGPTDDGTTDASESYKTLIKAIEEAGGPSYEFTEIAPEDKVDGGQPGGNIRVGFIYNPERVQLTDKVAGDAVTAVGVDADGLTHNPGRIDPANEAFEDSRKALAAEFMFNGEKVIVVANHFNSKGGDGALFGAEHPVILGSEVQRMKQAAVLNNFVQEVSSKVNEANVVVLGDLNDFEFSNPINTLEGDILTNMIEKLPTDERYTYIYQGNSQVLDHILVTNNLAKGTMIDSVNINSNFSEEDGRASDHDPVLAKIDFQDNGDTEPPTDPEDPPTSEEGTLVIDSERAEVISGVQKVNVEKVLEAISNYEGTLETITFELHSDADTLELPVTLVDSLQKKHSDVKVEVSADQGNFILPVELLKSNGNIQSVKLIVSEVKAQVANKVETEYDFVTPAIEFSVKVFDGKKDRTISHFPQYVEREINLSETVDPLKATAVLIKENGKIKAVPTIFKDDKAHVYSRANGTFAIMDMDKTFKDVQDRANWAEEYIEELASKHIVYGKSEDYYRPELNMTRGEFAALIARSLGLVASSPYDGQFSDVSGNEAVNGDGELVAAWEAGIIKGKENGTFKPYDSITRAEAAIMVARAVEFVGYSEDKLDTNKGHVQYKDAKYMSDQSLKAVDLLTQAGIVNGMAGGVYKPNDYTKRDQMAKMLAETLEFVGFMN
jgi:uncharacterized protein